MNDNALIELLKDMVEHKKREARFLFYALIAVVIMNIAEIGAFLWFELQWEYTDTITTEQEVSGDGSDIVNGDQIEGDQYNDQSQNRSNE